MPNTPDEHDFVTPEDERVWIDNPKNVDRIVYALYGMCALLLIIDVFVHKHSPFAIEYFPGFYAIYGFMACVGLVLVAKWLRKFLMRSETYYDE